MKKTLIWILLSLVLVLSACNNDLGESNIDTLPDIRIGLVGADKMDANIRASMQDYLNSLIPDVNGDGMFVSELVFYDLSDSAYGSSSTGYFDLMTTFFLEDDIGLFLVTDESIGENDGAYTIFNKNKDYFLAFSQNEYCFDLTASPLSVTIAAYWEMEAFPLYGFILDNYDPDLQTLSRELLNQLMEHEFLLSTEALQKSSNFFNTDPDRNATILTLGTLTDDMFIAALVAEYNATHDDYQIEIQCYTDDTENLSEAIDRVNVELMTGNTPDILYLDSLDIKSFESTGLLVDLSKYIQSDPSINDDNYLMNIWELFSYKGTTYELIPCFDIYGIVGPNEILPNKIGWTIEEYYALQEEFGQLLNIPADTLRAYMTRFAISPYIDLENAACSFNSSDFVRCLEFIKENGRETDEITHLRCGFLNSVTDYATYRDLFGNARFIGYPNSEQTSACAVALFSFGICSSTEYPEACWEFCKFVISDNVQRTIISNFGIPINRSIFQEQLDLATLPSEKSNSLFFDEDTEPLDNRDVEYIENLIHSINCAAFRYADVQSIIKEEITVYLSGDKDEEDIAKIIQNRVSIYLSEHS